MYHDLSGEKSRPELPSSLSLSLSLALSVETSPQLSLSLVPSSKGLLCHQRRLRYSTTTYEHRNNNSNSKSNSNSNSSIGNSSDVISPNYTQQILARNINNVINDSSDRLARATVISERGLRKRKRMQNSQTTTSTSTTAAQTTTRTISTTIKCPLWRRRFVDGIATVMFLSTILVVHSCSAFILPMPSLSSEQEDYANFDNKPNRNDEFMEKHDKQQHQQQSHMSDNELASLLFSAASGIAIDKSDVVHHHHQQQQQQQQRHNAHYSHTQTPKSSHNENEVEIIFEDVSPLIVLSDGDRDREREHSEKSRLKSHVASAAMGYQLQSPTNSHSQPQKSSASRQNAGETFDVIISDSQFKTLIDLLEARNRIRRLAPRNYGGVAAAAADTVMRKRASATRHYHKWGALRYVPPYGDGDKSSTDVSTTAVAKGDADDASDGRLQSYHKRVVSEREINSLLKNTWLG